MQKRDYYEVLGLEKSADADQIKKAYRKLAKQYHPDVNKAADAEEKFKEVQEAYDILSDEKKKQMYDQFGFAGVDPNAQGGFGDGGFGGFGGFQDFAGGVDLGDIFSSFFGGGSRGRQNYNGPRKGEDRYMKLNIDFMDAVNGKTTDISLLVDEKCSHCNGTGAKTPNDIKTCSRCNGKGTVYTEQRTPFGNIRQEAVCPECHGKGKIVSEKCPHCNGEGYIKKQTTFEVKIPAGIASHQQIRVAGRGGRGINSGDNGDLLIEIIVKNHPIFERDGNDLHMELKLTFPEAALGVIKTIPTVYGDIDLTIPEGIQDGKILKVKGKGIKSLRGNGYGDQYIHVKIVTPTKLSNEEKELYQKLGSLQGKMKETIFDKVKNAFKK